MNKNSIMFRLMGAAVVAALGLIAVSVLSAWKLKEDLTAGQIAKTRNIVEVARDMVKDIHRRAQAGEMDQAAARKMAADTLRSMRYDGKEYFFVYTLDGEVVVFPPKPEWEGTSKIDMADSFGLPIIRGLIERAKAGGGELTYYFPRPGGDQPVPKVSYALPFTEWNWFIGTGIYIDDIDAAFWRSISEFVGLSGVILLAVSGLTVLLARSVAGPIRGLADVTGRIGRGDYQIAVPAVDRKDEVGLLAKSILVLRDEAASAEALRREQAEAEKRSLAERRRAMLELADKLEGSVSQVVGGIVSAVDANLRAAEDMNDVAATARRDVTAVASATDQVNANIQTVASATEELAASIQEISSQVQQSTKISGEAVTKANETDAQVIGLAEAVERINQVVGLINDIASQTNLLALNATIEAARAGDAGKGFAVVANEVKSLANQTARATGEIGGQIEAVQQATDKAVHAIRDITKVIGTMNEVAATIAAAVEEQSAATHEISGSIHEAASGAQDVASYVSNLVAVTNRVGESAEAVAGNSGGLGKQSHTLEGEVSRFLATIRA